MKRAVGPWQTIINNDADAPLVLVDERCGAALAPVLSLLLEILFSSHVVGRSELTGVNQIPTLSDTGG